MHQPTYDLRIRAQKPLIAPAILEDELPITDEAAALVTRTRGEAAAILTGRDPRLLVVIGPCSIHDATAAFEYAERLRDVKPMFAGELLLVMRVYFEKPRTVFGWKGLVNDPYLDDSFQINAGLRIARKLMVQIVGAGVPVATEFLDTTLGQYYADLVTWGAIGARTVESQVHRELASGLSMPVGFKNRPDGDVQVAIDAIRSARHPHWFPSLTHEGAPAIMGTAGNEHTHLVLRGGSHGTNYGAASIREVTGKLRATKLEPYVMVDCSHGNSVKDPAREPLVAADIAGQVAEGERAIAAVMIESNLVGGTQDYRARPLVYGRSITDPCLAWEQTLPVLATLADAVKKRQTARAFAN